VRKSGEVRDVQVFRKKIWWNGAGQFQTLYLDITERKQAEFQKEAALEKSRKSEARLREVLDNSLEVSYKLNLQTNHYDYLSPVIARISGYASDEIKSLPFEAIMDFIHPDDHAEMERVIGESMSGASGTGYQMNYRFKNKNGQYRWCQDRFTVMRDAGGHPLAIIGSVSDITDRKKAEEELRESEKKYRLLADNVDDVIFVLDMNLNYTYVSPSIKILRGYEPEEVMKQPSSKTLTPSSWDLITKTVAEAIELEKTEHREINISRTLQLEMKRKDGTTVWVEVKASFIRDENQRLIGIMGVTRDITERRQAEEKLLETLNRLTKAVGATIQVLVSAIECRDPYTAGHQLRVADLARTIATEMGLPKDTIEGIRMAGSIHDIGKLSIPAEILSKPTKLTKIEFSLIKEHAEIGYEMLKNVESPWPLAQIVYQHHERMDGSGYPRNLKGNEILLEARIMAVADVVEAMASHRPYRPALGIDAALEEIEKNRGTLYDDAVADACLRLFREKGYKLIV
jgi:PAS domain S-box-containing protein/putative nucleotidyltransferase with HDIG domain